MDSTPQKVGTLSSTLTWLDVSDRERKRALDVIDMFRESDTRDELGLGVIRDGFAEALFPGTSTIQTRAAYFLLIPWTACRLEERLCGSSGVAGQARGDEIRLIDALTTDGDLDGVIGQDARRNLKRLPSEVYWSGLRRWGIRLFPGSREQYYRQIESGLLGGRPRVDLETDGTRRALSGWHANLPTPPDGFPNEASMALRPDDATYLAERILVTCPGTLLAHLVEEPKIGDQRDFVWTHPAVRHAPPAVQEMVEQARRFSELMRGSALLYNRLIAEERKADAVVDDYDRDLSTWAAGISEIPWDGGAFWEQVERATSRVGQRTRAFVNEWTALATTLGAAPIQSLPAASDLIRRRERDVKRHQVRLGRPEALWGGNAGTGQLDFRWSTAWRLLHDITEGRRAADA